MYSPVGYKTCVHHHAQGVKLSDLLEAWKLKVKPVQDLTSLI